MDRSNWPPYNINYYNQIHQEDDQHTSQPEIGQTSSGATTSGALLGQSYLNPNTPAPIPSSPGADLEYLLRTLQPTALDEMILPQPEAGQTSAGVPANRASGQPQPYSQPYLDLNEPASISFSPGADWEYILGSPQSTTLEEVIQNDAQPNPQPAASAPRQRQPVKERFMEGLEAFEQGVSLKKCSPFLQFRDYIYKDGSLTKKGRTLYRQFTPEEKARFNQAIIARQGAKLIRLADDDTVKERFLAGLNSYAEGVKLIDCSATIAIKNYVTTEGALSQRGHQLYLSLPPEEQKRVDQALTARARIFTQGAAKDVDKFMAALKPYANGLTLQACGKWSGLKSKASMYLTSEGGLTPKGNRLIENLQPDQLNEVWNAIGERQRCMESNPLVLESLWQGLEMPSSMPEMPGINQTAMADPTQTDAMWATVWQLTGQPVQGAWEIASEPVEPHIDSFGIDAVGADFRHRYGPNGLLPQRAPDRLISLGIWQHRLINILGETYRVQSLAGGVAPSNENPYGQSFMLVPHMRGG
ncbi:MAG: hypothetical protein P8X74_06660 [Reinekea sp.]